ncbi:DUF1996 domain-containing protein [Actinocrispum sp. NPDC049592]|uniref:DUF1996 domain-containing protein n=1 Tax=Actinocrispum sp. NPDC049592 TaxID=3154835 RepID=UPI003436999D
MPRTNGRHRISRTTKIAAAGIGLAMAIGTLVVITTTGSTGSANADAADPSFFVDITKVKPNVKLAKQQNDASTGTFTVDCGENQNGHFNPDNFIAQPGIKNGAQHLHDYVGNLSTNADSSNQSLLKAGTTCKNGDQSAYFWPVIRIDREDNAAKQKKDQQQQQNKKNQQQKNQDANQDNANQDDAAQNDQQNNKQQQNKKNNNDAAQNDQQANDQQQADNGGRKNLRQGQQDQNQGGNRKQQGRNQDGQQQNDNAAQDKNQNQDKNQQQDQNKQDQNKNNQNDKNKDNKDQNADQQDEELEAPQGADQELAGNDGQILQAANADITFRGSPTGDVVPMPKFLRILYGDAKQSQNGPKNARDSWTCAGFEDRVLIDKYPICPNGAAVKRIHDFPSCWDGKNTDSENHRDHIVFPDENGQCKKGFKAVPQLRITLTYNIPQDVQQKGQYKVDAFPFEEHNPKSDHDDFANVMSNNLMNRVVDCINSGKKCKE